jgi:lipopolysaccharide biosynthesis glycosyltransferase
MFAEPPANGGTGRSPALAARATRLIACVATEGIHHAKATQLLQRANELTSIPIDTRVFMRADLPGLDAFDDLPRLAGYPLEVWGRYLIPFVAETRHEKILYLDTDVMVQRDLAPLFDPYAYWAGKEIGAVPLLRKHSVIANSGVLLIDAPAYRRRHTPATLAQRARDVFARRPSVAHQQDEALLHDLGWTPIPPAFNVRELLYSHQLRSGIQRAAQIFTPHEIIDAILHPVIRHPY